MLSYRGVCPYNIEPGAVNPGFNIYVALNGADRRRVTPVVINVFNVLPSSPS